MGRGGLLLWMTKIRGGGRRLEQHLNLTPIFIVAAQNDMLRLAGNHKSR